MLSSFSSGSLILLLLLVDSVLLWFLAVRKYLSIRSRDIDISDALNLLSEAKPLNKALGIKASMVKEFLEKRTGDRNMDKIMLRRISDGVRKRMWRDISLIHVLSVIAPLLGLLGTVTGMIKVFYSLMLYGTGNVKAMASGISEALVTTQGGLIVAIPGMYMTNFLRRRIEKIEMSIDEIVLALERHI